MLRIENLVKRFGGLVATDHANLTVEAGEIHALIGPNGAGKTTLLHQISGSLRPNTGTITFDGRNVTHTSMHDRVRMGLARSYQITNTFKNFSVLDNVALAVQARSGSSYSFFGAARRERQIFDEAHTVLERIGLGRSADDLAGSIAHGQQRQLELGIALATNPKLMVLDEPMAGMGPDESLEMVALLETLRGKVTMLLVEHDMDAVFRLADRISVLVYGRVIASGAPDEIRVSPEVQKAYLGEGATA